MCGSNKKCGDCSDDPFLRRTYSVVAQLNQLRRTMRDAFKHRNLVSKLNRQPLDSELVSIESEGGKKLLNEAEEGSCSKALREAVFSQSHPAFCALAACAVVVRAHRGDYGAIAETEHPDQDFFSREVAGPGELPPMWFHFWGFPMFDRLPDWLRKELTSFIKYDGLPLGAVREIMTSQGFQAELHCGSQVSESMLRDILEEAATSDNMYVLLNVGRRALGQRGDGHFFISGGVHRRSDRALLLEVNTWRYPSTWARISAVHASLQTTTMSGQPRGFIVVRRADDAQVTTMNGVPLSVSGAHATTVPESEPQRRAGVAADPGPGAWQRPRQRPPRRALPALPDFADMRFLNSCAQPCAEPCRAAC